MKISTADDFLKYGADPLATLDLAADAAAPREQLTFFGFLWKSYWFAMNTRSFFSRTISVILGFAIPAYFTYKSLKKNNAAQQSSLLRYWLIYALYSIAEYLAWPILQYFPFYFEIKCALLVALWHPDVGGATKIYEKFVRPHIERHEKKIDEGYEKVNKAIEPGMKKVKVVAEDGWTKVQQQASADGPENAAKKAAKALVQAKDVAAEKVKQANQYMADAPK